MQEKEVVLQKQSSEDVISLLAEANSEDVIFVSDHWNPLQPVQGENKQFQQR